MKKKIAVVTGGFSGEAIISQKSALTVMNNLSTEKYETYKVTISKENWTLEHDSVAYAMDKNDFSCTINNSKIIFDAVFMILHGTPGEDGKLQGYFDMLGISYTCCGATTSALTFNKGLTTRVLKTYGILVADSVILLKGEAIDTNKILTVTGLPCFVKPNNGGSSIGISRVNTAEELEPAITKAFNEDDEIIIEQFMQGTEVTCGVTTMHGTVKALAVTEIVCNNEFFDFEAKYNDQSTQEITPARIPEDQYNSVMKTTERLYKLLQCKGMVRIDYIIQKGIPFVIEVNTIPGLTAHSLIPQHAAYCGISTEDLFGNCIESALN